MNEEALQKILEQTEKEARFTRVIAIIMAIMLAVFLLVVMLIVPRVLSTLRTVTSAVTQAQELMTQGEEAISEVRAALEGVDDMTGSIRQFSDEALKGISEVDFETLSQAITDLHAAVEPFAKFARALGGGR